MKMRRSFVLFVLALLIASTLHAQSYRGVEVGERGDLLPAQFNKVANGEFDANFGTERMRVFVNGALVTGFTVTPAIPLTLAEAVALHGSTADVPQMLLLLDPDGDPQGIVDPIKRISYITRAIGPEGIIDSVGYYDQNTALLNWTDDADPALLKLLQSAAQQVSLQEINSRPRLANVNARARFLMDEALKAANKDLRDLNVLLPRYRQSCADAMSSTCQDAKRTQAPVLMQTADRFRFAVKLANDVYATNPDLFANRMPPQLARLNETADRLLPQVPSIPQALR
jgi:hypothetical protein